jgi:hypothetical protein
MEFLYCFIPFFNEKLLIFVFSINLQTTQIMAIIKSNTIKPNEGDCPPHGGDVHNEAINQKIAEMIKEKYESIRKNQQQVDKEGNVVGLNRPDIQGDKDEIHVNIEFDFDPKRSADHGKTIMANDPDCKLILNLLNKK